MEPTPSRALSARAASIAAISLLALAVVLALTSGAARAQSAEAERRFTEAEALLAAGKVEEACEAFEESNRLEERAGTLINLGLCKEKLGKLASALTAYRGALERVKDPKKKAIATERATALEGRVSKLTIKVSPDARVEGLTISRDGERVSEEDYDRPLPVDGGSYELEARAPGYRRWSTSIRVAPEGDRASVTVPALAPRQRDGAGPPDAGAGGAGGAGAKSAEPAPARAAGSYRRPLKIAGFGLVGVSVASAAYVLYATVAGPIADYEGSGRLPLDDSGMQVFTSSDVCDSALGAELRNGANADFEANRAFDAACTANSRRVVAGWVGLISGIAGGVALYIAYRGSDDPAAGKPAAAADRRARRRLTVTPELGPTGAGATLRFAW